MEMKLSPRLAFEFKLIQKYLLKDIIPRERKKPESNIVSDDEITFAFMVACSKSIIEEMEKK